ncbi:MULTISPECIES: hypothetical protein [unclassified Yoonia]|uniref:hypothetical protein n=1 Tax=unclassified Yoonia TaxID=2629118 RepID=UPI002AFEF0BC|nr:MULTISPECIES: hypothetical protein [unclassified Yoonia]
MTINFALSLTYAGIDLLQRSPDGWRRVGTASLLSADLAADLARLRAKGEALAPEGLKTKIVIPSEQIKYLAIDSTQTTLADVQAVLDGATPYQPEELAIDFERFGGRTHIAAVARETLKEAEDFAQTHGFNPVCFVAVPEPFTFRQEIFFGPTSVAPRILGPHSAIDRDTLPVLLVGTRIKSHLLVVDQGADAAPAQPQQAPATHNEVAPIAPVYLDRVISEYHARPLQTEVPLIAVPMAGSPRPVILGGVVDVPAPARQRRSFAIPGTIAASVAALSLALWALYDPTTPIDTPVETAAISSAENPEPGVVDLALTAPDQSLPPATLPDDDARLALDTAPAPLVSDTADAELAIQPETPAEPRAIGRVLTPDEAAAVYAATGVWQRAPRFVDLPEATVNDSVIWPVSVEAPDQIALPALPSIGALSTDLSFVPLVNPPAADVVFDLDDEGFVRATEEGAVTPDGAVVYAGLPDLPFRERPGSVEAVAADEIATAAEVPEEDATTDLAQSSDDTITVIEGRPPVVPPVRPETASPADVAEADADAPTPGGVALNGLLPDAESTQSATASLAPPPGAIRPRLRPDLPQVATNPDEVNALLGGIAFAEPDPLEGASALAVAASLRPTLRPTNFDQVVAAARSRQQPAAAPEPEPEPEPQVAAAPAATPQPAAPAPAPPPAQVAAPVAPQNYAPVPGGVARAATQENAIRMRDVNLIGVYGQANARRALVRLGNGQYIRVQVGSELDGGQVTAIGENALNYVKRGTTYALQIPSG